MLLISTGKSPPIIPIERFLIQEPASACILFIFFDFDLFPSSGEVMHSAADETSWSAHRGILSTQNGLKMDIPLRVH